MSVIVSIGALSLIYLWLVFSFFLNAEIPALVKCVKDLIATMKRMPPVMDTDSTCSGSSSPAPEMVCFAFIHVL